MDNHFSNQTALFTKSNNTADFHDSCIKQTMKPSASTQDLLKTQTLSVSSVLSHLSKMCILLLITIVLGHHNLSVQSSITVAGWFV